jgi:hypothetical protein
MAIYTIYVMSATSAVAAADEARLVSDRFDLSAMLLGPIWLACNRLWWPLAAYALAGLALAAAAYGLHLPVAASALVFLLIGCFLGLEGRPLVEATLRRRGFEMADLVAAASREEAERIFFSRWLMPRPSLAAAAPRPSLRSGQSDAIIGLFPDRGGKS